MNRRDRRRAERAARRQATAPPPWPSGWPDPPATCLLCGSVPQFCGYDEYDEQGSVRLGAAPGRFRLFIWALCARCAGSEDMNREINARIDHLFGVPMNAALGLPGDEDRGVLRFQRPDYRLSSDGRFIRTG